MRISLVVSVIKTAPFLSSSASGSIVPIYFLFRHFPKILSNVSLKNSEQRPDQLCLSERSLQKVVFSSSLAIRVSVVTASFGIDYATFRIVTDFKT